MYGHGEELQARAGQAAAGGSVQPGRQQRAGGGRGRAGAVFPPLQHPVDPERRPVQGPADHPEPAGDDPDQSVLPGLLAVRRPADGRPQGQRPEGAQRAEEAPQPPASRGGGGERGAGGGRDMRSPALCRKHPQPPSHPTPPPPPPPPRENWERLIESSDVKKKKSTNR